MFTQSGQIGEQWSHIRDFQDRGISRDDGRELFHITKVEFQAPSKAHLKRLARPRPMVVVKRRAAPVAKPQNERFNAVRAQALEIVAINNPHAAAKRLGKLSQMFSAKHPSHPFVPAKPQAAPVAKPRDPDCAVPAWRRDSNQRNHLIALEKMLYRPFVPTLDQCCDIFAIFGSYDNFLAAAHPASV